MVKGFKVGSFSFRGANRKRPMLYFGNEHDHAAFLDLNEPHLIHHTAWSSFSASTTDTRDKLSSKGTARVAIRQPHDWDHGVGLPLAIKSKTLD